MPPCKLSSKQETKSTFIVTQHQRLLWNKWALHLKRTRTVYSEKWLEFESILSSQPTTLVPFWDTDVRTYEILIKWYEKVSKDEGQKELITGWGLRREWEAGS